LVRFR